MFLSSLLISKYIVVFDSFRCKHKCLFIKDLIIGVRVVHFSLLRHKWQIDQLHLHPTFLSLQAQHPNSLIYPLMHRSLIKGLCSLSISFCQYYVSESIESSKSSNRIASIYNSDFF